MICAIVLAAGRSQRMGTQKLLLPIAGRPAVARIVDELQQNPLHTIVMVIGVDGEKIQHAISGNNIVFVRNPDAQGDMLSSIRCGLRALPAGCAAVLVVLGDQPSLTSELVAKLIGAFEQTGRGLILPTYKDNRGHPVLVATRFRDELLERHDDVGLRGLLAQHPEEIFAVESPDLKALQDMDTPEDYQRHLTARAD